MKDTVIKYYEAIQYWPETCVIDDVFTEISEDVLYFSQLPNKSSIK